MACHVIRDSESEGQFGWGRFLRFYALDHHPTSDTSIGSILSLPLGRGLHRALQGGFHGERGGREWRHQPFKFNQLLQSEQRSSLTGVHNSNFIVGQIFFKWTPRTKIDMFYSFNVCFYQTNKLNVWNFGLCGPYIMHTWSITRSIQNRFQDSGIEIQGRTKVILDHRYFFNCRAKTNFKAVIP